MENFWTLLKEEKLFHSDLCNENPGEYPFTRGLHTDGYRKRKWTIRQYAGFGTAKETNQRFKYLLGQGQTGLSVAFDLPTQMGFDSDHPRSQGEVGKVGVAINSLDDMETLFDGIPLDQTSISMTINATAPVLLLMLQCVAEKQGVELSKLRGTVQNDILKEYVARGTYIFPPRPSLRMAANLIEYSAKNLPNFNPVSVSGYHMKDAGCTTEQEMGLALSHAKAYLDAVIQRGVQIDDFAPRISWIFNTQSEFFAEVAKYRALRRMWAKLLKESYQAKDKKSYLCRVHSQTGGATLTAQQPENNIVRAAFQALSAVLGGVQSLALSCYDEAIALPTSKAQEIAVRSQQIIAHETGVTETVDPLGGAPYVEKLTDELEKRALEVMKKIDEAGGAVSAIESGLTQSMIDESAYLYQKQVDSGERVIVGVNQFKTKEPPFSGEMFKVNPQSVQEAKKSLLQVKKKRNLDQVVESLEQLKTAAKQKDDDLMQPILHAVKMRATVGEISDSLRAVFGEHDKI